MLIVMVFFTFFIGAFFSCYCQIHCSLSRVFYYWRVLLDYSLKERELLEIFLTNLPKEQQIISQQKNWLNSVIDVDRKQFRYSGEELMRLFISMEEELNIITTKILENEELVNLCMIEKEYVCNTLEKFLAIKNLFEFQSYNYNNIVQRYLLTQRKKTCLWLSSLLSYPSFPIKIPSFY